MKTCDNCGAELDSMGNCPNQPSYPEEGDICCCGGTIRMAGMDGYEEHYYCMKCGEDWYYD